LPDAAVGFFKKSIITIYPKKEGNMSAEEREDYFLKAKVAYHDLGTQIDFIEDEELESTLEHYTEDLFSFSQPVERELVKGVIEAINLELKIRKTWKTGKGAWIAVLVKTTWDSPKQLEATGDEIEVIRCKGKKEAIEAAKKLYQKHAGLFDGLSYITAEIMPEIAYWKMERSEKRYA